MGVLDRARESFKAGLTRKAEKTKALQAAGRGLRAHEQRPGELSASEAQLEIREQLAEILEHMRKHKPGDSGNVKFVVTERDASGAIKAFKVERA